LLYKDFGSDASATNIWGYIMRKYGLSYPQALDKIAMDLGLVPSTHQLYDIQPDTSIQATPRQTEINIKSREWLIKDKMYWNEKYLIPLELLQEYNVKPITHFWVNDRLYKAAPLSYCYNYYEYSGRLLRKIYQPYSPIKWISNINGTVVQGIANIPKQHNLLIITKSLKDIMCLRLIGYYSIATNNELSWIPDSVWQKLKQRYDRIVIFYDNDITGLTSASKFSSMYDIPYIYLPESCGAKDISDYIEVTKNLDKSIQMINTLLL
jgi:hypothetical protein